MPRKILALYTKGDPVHTPIHRHAEVILNHLGLEVVYRSMEKPLPTEEEMKNFRGVLTWFQNRSALPNMDAYCAWGEKQIHQGRRLVLLGYPSVINFDPSRPDQKPSTACVKMMEAFGLRYFGNYSDNPFYLQIVRKNSDMVEFERKLSFVEANYFGQFKATDPRAKIYLQIERRDLEESRSDLVFTSPRGGFAFTGYVYYHTQEPERTSWRINPFRFFNEAFGLQGLPRPDATTINGRRIFYSHIDGDGIVSKSHIDNKSYTGEIILREILQKYPTLPITASFISGYFDMPAYQTERAEEMARAIASLPNTEVASHGHAHPLSWRKQKLALDVPGYTYSDTAEILGSAEKINARLKKWGIDKKVGLFSWTGDCFPTEEQTAIPAQGNLLNINGGDSRFDKRYPSYAYLYPLGIARGNSRQIYAGNANEHPYTSGWEGPFYGFQEVIETFQNTESPVRIKPINLYYHYYSGETFASLHVLKKAYDYALSQDIFPMFASQYAALVQDFFDLQIILLPNGGTRIRNSGHLRTIRWDHETRNVNLERSRGVLGFSHFQGSLYVFLDEGKTHDIYLTN